MSDTKLDFELKTGDKVVHVFYGEGIAEEKDTGQLPIKCRFAESSCFVKRNGKSYCGKQLVYPYNMGILKAGRVTIDTRVFPEFDELVLVSIGYGCPWYYRCFSHFADGEFYFFNSRESGTNSGSTIWNFWKFPDESTDSPERPEAIEEANDLVSMDKEYSLEGETFELLCVNAGGEFPVVGLKGKLRELKRFSEIGVNDHGSGTNWDLVEVKPRIKSEIWCNIYQDRLNYGYPCRSDADANAGEGRIACVPMNIDCEHGEGLSDE